MDQSVSPGRTTTVGAGPAGAAASPVDAATMTPTKPANTSSRANSTSRPRRVSRTPARRAGTTTVAIVTPSSNGSSIELTYDGLPDRYDRSRETDATRRTDV